MISISTTAPILDIVAKRGVALEIPFVVTDEDGALVDLTVGWNGMGFVRRKRRSAGSPLAQMLFVPSLMNLGHMKMVLSVEQLNGLPYGELPTHAASQYVYDIRLNPVSGGGFGFARGNLWIDAEATRSFELTTP